MPSVTIRLTADQHERLVQHCEDEGTTVSNLLRGVIDRLDDHLIDRKARQPIAPIVGAELVASINAKPRTLTPGRGTPKAKWNDRPDPKGKTRRDRGDV